MVCLNQKGEKCEITRGHFTKITETAWLLGWEFATQTKAGMTVT